MINEASLEEKILRKRVDTLFRKNRLGLPGIFVFVLVFLYAYQDYEDKILLALWAGLVVCIAIAQWLFMRRYFAEKEIQNVAKWRYKLTLFTMSMSILVGSSVWVFYMTDNLQQTFVVAVLVIGSMFGSVIFAASYFPIHVAWSVPLALPLSMVLLEGNAEQMILGALLLFAGIPVALILGWMLSQEYAAALRLRFEKDALLESLQKQKETADKANQDKTQFLAAASHDLRQPHQALGLFVEALDHMETDIKKKEILSKTKQAFQAMSSLLDQLLDISKLDSANIKADKQAVALQPLLHQVVMEHMGEAEKKDIELRLMATREAAFVDPAMLTRIVSNLLTNAIHYTQKGGVLLAVRKREGKLRVDVWDTGVGIPDGKLDYIFKEFTQLRNPERDREKGLGLGLAIVQRLTNILGAKIQVTSKLHQGSRFSLYLDAIQADLVLPNIEEPFDKQALGGLNVVVIDDDEIALEGLRTLLLVWGCEVSAFTSLQHAMDRLKVMQHQPDVLIVDYRLGGGENGVAVIAAVRAAFKHDIPALIVTGDTAPESIQAAKATGLPLLYKPVKPNELRTFLVQVNPL